MSTHTPRLVRLSDLAEWVGQDVAVSDWVLITQDRVNQFAQATGDFQWIHVDPVRAAQGPFGGTIAHGFLTLSLIPLFFESAIDLQPTGMGINYGLNKVRFTSPVRVGSRLRAHLKLLQATPLENNGAQLTWEVKVECDGLDKPVCIAESIARRYP